MLEQDFFFPNRIHEKQSRIKKKSNWIPPPSNSSNLISFFTRVEQELVFISIPHRKTYSNLTLKEKKAMSNLRNNQSIVVKPCDKGGGHLCYEYEKLHPHTLSRSQYKQITNPQPSKRYSLWCLQSHTLHAFPTHNRHHCNEISTASKEYSHTSFLWTTKNAQATLPCPPYWFWMWWSNHWSSYITHFIQPLANNHLSHIKDKTFPQLHWKAPTRPTQCILGNSWCHVRTHKHSTWWWYSRGNLFHGRIQASVTHKLYNSSYSSSNLQRYCQVHHFWFHRQTHPLNPWYLRGNKDDLCLYANRFIGRKNLLWS